MRDVAQMTFTSSVIQEPKEFVALDGYPLRGRHVYSGQQRARLLVAGATGVPQGFYRAFAEYAALRGFEVFTFDYRGVGESAPKSLRGFEMDLRDWARLDLAGVIANLDGDMPIHLVGHSYGGHALGILPDLSPIASLHSFATGAGWHGWMPQLERFRVKFLWNVMGPVVVKKYGYLSWKRFGFGEDLPLGVFLQWKHWCSFPNYWFDDPELGLELSHMFSRVTLPITAYNSIDDRWATPTSRDVFFSRYTDAKVNLVDLNPASYGVRKIGHMGYFRRGLEKLWDEALAQMGTLG